MGTMNNVKRGLGLSGLLMAASLATNGWAADAAKSTTATSTDPSGRCSGVNSCKGTGACGGAGHSCAGQNACKGQGWSKSSKSDCDKQGGKFTADATGTK